MRPGSNACSASTHASPAASASRLGAPSAKTPRLTQWAPADFVRLGLDRRLEMTVIATAAGTAPTDLFENPLGTDGFEFVEFTAPEPERLKDLFERMGFVAVSRHRSKNVLRFAQGDI